MGSAEKERAHLRCSAQLPCLFHHPVLGLPEVLLPLSLPIFIDFIISNGSYASPPLVPSNAFHPLDQINWQFSMGEVTVRISHKFLYYIFTARKFLYFYFFCGNLWPWFSANGDPPFLPIIIDRRQRKGFSELGFCINFLEDLSDWLSNLLLFRQARQVRDPVQGDVRPQLRGEEGWDPEAGGEEAEEAEIPRSQRRRPRESRGRRRDLPAGLLLRVLYRSRSSRRRSGLSLLQRAS